MDQKLLEILVCPICKGRLRYQKDKNELICTFDRLAFPVKQEIPIMLESEARLLTLVEIDSLDQN